jgi:hypothetical protein
MSRLSNETEFTIDHVVDRLDVLIDGISHQIKIMKKILDIVAEDSRLEGTSITNTFTLQTGAQVTKIDFVEAKHAGVPTGVSFDVPLKPVALLKINNLGPGLVLYSTNKGLSQFEAAEQIIPGEVERIKLKKRAIKQLNIVANQQYAKVRVTAWV